MGNKNQYDELLVRYLAGGTDMEETQTVESWINASEENHRYFTSFKTTWELASVKPVLDYVLDVMDVDKKWDQFKVSMDQPTQKTPVRSLFIAAAVAASIITVIIIGYNFMFPVKQPENVALHIEKKQDSVAITVLHEVNTTGKNKTVQLPDSSLVVMADKSEIFYKSIFVGTRDITLIGKAFFKVAKDKTKPFTVISGDIATTALGTEFTVTALPKSKRIIVRLYEGKVVIKPVDKTNRLMTKAVYLLPGQEFVYGKTIFTVPFKLKKDVVAEEVLNEESHNYRPSLPENTGGNWYMFNNQSLDQVLQSLSAFYEVKIVYDKKDVKDIYFTGKYNKSDSLEIIIDRIAKLNNLKVIKNDTALILTK